MQTLLNNKMLKVLLAGFVLLTASTMPVIAQDDAAADEELAPLTEESEAPAEESSLLGVLLKGGWAMVPLGLLSVATVGLTVYNFIAVRKSNFIDAAVIEELEAAANKLDVETARRICEENAGPVTNTFKQGLDQITNDIVVPEAIDKAFESASMHELSGPFAMIGYLSTIAAIAPMVGLLGTVSGMIKAFESIASQGMGKPDLLANNISEALVTTATGMAIAIVAMLFYFIFKTFYTKIAAEISLILGRLYGDLLRASQQRS